MLIIWILIGFAAGYLLGESLGWGIAGAVAALLMFLSFSSNARKEVAAPSSEHLRSSSSGIQPYTTQEVTTICPSCGQRNRYYPALRSQAICSRCGSRLFPEKQVSTTPWTNREPITLTKEQEDILRLLLQTKWSHHAYFVTGPAGTGKSTLLSAFHKKTHGRSAIVAPTGIAALLVGGQTIHSFFKFPPRLLRYRNQEDIRLFSPRSSTRKVLEALEYLIIDEVSMVRVDLMDAIDWSLRINRGRPHDPFGGVKVAMFGDPMQLEPVVKGPEEQMYINDIWGGHFFFDARVWHEASLLPLKLHEIHRQKDPEFMNLLKRLREGDESALEELNRRVVRENGHERPGVVVLTPRKIEADNINYSRLNSLPGPERVYRADISGQFEEDEIPTEINLQLKVGAQVMLLKNSKDYVNGDIGTITYLGSDSVIVRLRRGHEVVVTPANWEKVKYEYDKERKEIVPKIVGRFRQLPLRLAWALTIHKAQGLTLDAVHVEVGRGMFAHGQLYVALSRARSLDGLTISRPLGHGELIWHKRVRDFLEYCEMGKPWGRER